MSGFEHAFFRVNGNHDFGRDAPAGGRPASCSSAQMRREWNRISVSTRQPSVNTNRRGATVLAGLRIADHGAGTVIGLRLFAPRRLDDACFRRSRAAQSAAQRPDALIGTGEAMPVYQFLPDGHGVAALRQASLDEFAIRSLVLVPDSRGFRVHGVGGHLAPIGRFCRFRVGGHLIGRF